MIYKAITNARQPYGRNEGTALIDYLVLILNLPGMGEVIYPLPSRPPSSCLESILAVISY